jgi:tetratricopeptide (TPR) repeat protein
MKKLLWLVLLMPVALSVSACQSTPQQATGAPAAGTPTPEQLYQEGRAAYEAGDYVIAAEKFAEVAAADPEHVKALINWGAALAQNGQPLEAISKYQQALARDPNNAAAYYNWGVALERLRKHAEAIEKYERAVALQSDLLTPALQSYLQRRRPLLQDTQIGTPPAKQ